MPGVVVQTSVRTGPTTSAVAPASTFFVAGFTERGLKNTPQLLRSWAEFLDYYGDYVSYSHAPYAVKTYFEEGGTRAYVSRMVGPSATKGTLSLQDRIGPATDITFTAASEGAWSSNVTVEVQDVTGQVSPTSKVVVRYKTAIIYISRGYTSASALVTELNTAAALTNVFTAVAVTNNPPAVVAATALTSGVDDRATVDLDANRVTQLANFGYELGTGAVALPGYGNSTIYDGLVAHANAYRRICLCAFGQSDTIATVKSAIASYYANQYADRMAFYYPWINIPGTVSGTLLQTSPEGYAAGARARAQIQAGPWRPGAGKLSEAIWVTSPLVALVKADGDDLDASRINAIRVFNGIPRIYGARSASQDEVNFRFITARDTMNFIIGQAEARLEDYVFYTIDSRGGLFGLIAGSLIALLDPISKAGGLFSLVDRTGNTVDPGYKVTVDDVLNPSSQLASGLVKAKIGVRVSSVGDQIQLIITKSDLSTGI